MIRLTSKYTEGAFYVNPDHIISIGCNNAGDTTVELTTDIEDAVRHVAEPPEEVARKVLEWRLMMFQYQTYLAKAQETDDWTRTAAIRKALTNLAGLEEPNHDP